jgi:hypothetical protein
MRRRVVEGIQIAGAGLLTAGSAMVWPPLGFIVCGVLLIVGGEAFSEDGE